MDEEILKYFSSGHLQPKLQVISEEFGAIARALCNPADRLFVPKSAERSVALRKLLEGKDAAVRAAIV